MLCKKKKEKAASTWYPQYGQRVSHEIDIEDYHGLP